MVIRGFYLIQTGNCELQTPTGWLDYFLAPGDFCGESLLFDTESITRFGRIKARGDV